MNTTEDREKRRHEAIDRVAALVKETRDLIVAPFNYNHKAVRRYAIEREKRQCGEAEE